MSQTYEEAAEHRRGPSAEQSGSRVAEFLQSLGAHRQAHGNGRTLYHHLIGTRQILSRWGQPEWMQDAGALHSIYSTDVYQSQLLAHSQRSAVQHAMGARAERLAYLFGALSRKHFFKVIDACDELPESLPVKRHAAGPDPLESLSRDEMNHLLLLYMANEAEQAQGPSGEPGLWLARVSWMGSKLSASAVTIPPLFDACTARLAPEAEDKARKSYLDGIRSLSDPAAASRHFSAAAEICPWVAEPKILAAYLVVQQGKSDEACRGIASARKNLTELGASWDKRLSYANWLWLISFLEEVAVSGAISSRLPPIDLQRPYQTLEALSQLTAQRLPNGNHPTSDVDQHSSGRVSQSDDAGSARFQRYLESFAQNHSSPRMTFYPDLPSRPWHDPSDFPLAQRLETDYAAIRQEMLSLDASKFHRESESIKRTGSWDVLMLYERGRKNEENCAQCPVTTHAIETNNTVRTLAGLIYFSRMKAGTHIAAHRGPTNLRLRCHLGIRIPDGDCGLRVAGETRGWNEGKCIVFDDYYEHEAWNHTAAERIVLIVDLWHPELTVTEVALLEGLHRYAYSHGYDLSRYFTANARAARQYD